MSGQFSHLILRFEVSLCLLLLQIKLFLEEKLSHLKTNHPHSIGVVVPSNCKLSHWKPPLPVPPPGLWDEKSIKLECNLVKLGFCVLDRNIYCSFLDAIASPIPTPLGPSITDTLRLVTFYQSVSKCIKVYHYQYVFFLLSFLFLKNVFLESVFFKCIYKWANLVLKQI